MLPKGVCQEIEKQTRRFIWGGAGSDTKTISLVNWETVTRSKAKGGLGIRRLQDLNLACMAKLGWRIRCEENSLWAQTLSTKYKCVTERGRSSVSNAWKGIVAAAPIVENGVYKIVRNGKQSRFWMDNWLGEYPLYEVMKAPVSLPDLYASVADYWDEDRGWKWELFQQLIPATDTERVAGYILSNNLDEEDAMGWWWEKGQDFTIRSAYNSIIGSTSVSRDFNWARIWSLKVPIRICMFLWLVKHGRVMTNVERAKRNMTSNVTCVFYAGHAEDLDHFFRKCSEVKPF